MNRHTRIIIMLLGVFLAQCSTSQNYHANYTSISIASMIQSDTVEFSTWLSIDTVNIHSNSHMVIVEDLECISNKRFSYFTSRVRKTNVGTFERTATHEVLVDHKNKIIYLLNEKTAFPCISHAIDAHSGKDSTYIRIVKSGNRESHISFDKSIPKEVSNRLVSKDRQNGITQVWSNKIKMTLDDYRTYGEFDFTSLLNRAKKECEVQEQILDLIFP